MQTCRDSHSPNINTLIAAFALICGLAVTGCQSTGTGGSTSANLARTTSETLLLPPDVTIRVGSPVDNVINSIGQPDRVVPSQSDSASEVWHFVRTEIHREDTVIDIQEVAVAEPAAGRAPLQIPIHGIEVTTITQTLRLFVSGDRVMGWDVEEDRHTEIEQ